jgi:hypothetical protein
LTLLAHCNLGPGPIPPFRDERIRPDGSMQSDLGFFGDATCQIESVENLSAAKV